MTRDELSAYPINATEAARYTGVSLGYLYNLLSEGNGPRHVKYGGQLRFRLRDLDAWIARRCRTAGDETN